ncbi:hypothetical protein [Deinococcus sonorensis]|uniref:Transmembrane protein n=2 Tax=Deinococcus sonorensis TaxID=309891 RepID=A0AAU7UCS7_9DEIO
MTQDPVGRWLLTVAALVLFALGVPLLFAADVVSGWLDVPSPSGEVLAQLAAGGLLGLGVMNWWSRGQFVGGIYGRPLGLSNLLCFLSAGASLGRATASGGLPSGMWGIVLVFTALAVTFAWRVLFFRPQADARPAPGV